MRLLWAPLCAALLAPPAAAQEAQDGTGVVLRALDKISGRVRDLEMEVGTTARFDRIEIDHAACRYPVGNPEADAYALLRVRDALEGRVVFAGWMVASAPAVSALDHARYDLWVLRCVTPEDASLEGETTGDGAGAGPQMGAPAYSPRPTPRP